LQSTLAENSKDDVMEIIMTKSHVIVLHYNYNYANLKMKIYSK